MPSFRVTLESNELPFLEELSRASCNEAQSGFPEGVSIQITEQSARHGFVDSTIIVSILVATVSGVAANVISTLICDKWRQHAKRIKVSDIDVTEESDDKIEKIVEKAIKGGDS